MNMDRISVRPGLGGRAATRSRWSPRSALVLVSRGSRGPRLAPSGGAVSSTRHGAFVSTYSVTSPISSGRAAADPAEDRAAADPRRRLAAHHDHLGAAPARLLDDAGADRARRDDVGLDLDGLVLLADLLRALERRASPPRLLRGGAARRAARVSGISIT